MNILFVVPYVPGLVRVRSYQLIRNLVEAGHRVSLGTLWYDEQDLKDLEEMHRLCERVFAFRLRKWRSLVNCVFAIPGEKPLQYVYCWEPALAKALEEFIFQNSAAVDCVHVEHLRGAIYGAHLLARFSHLPLIWDSVDSISHLFRQSATQSQQTSKRWITQFELPRTEKYEYRLARQFKHVLVTSPIDREQFFTLRGGSGQIAAEQVSVLPNGVDLDYFYPLADEARQKDTVVLSGKMSYHANVSMTLFLVKEIMPLVWEKHPGVKLWIVGKDPSREVLKLAENPLITVTGTVPDLRQYLQRATLAVAPIIYGAGIQNKVLEAMACATPVVTSPQAIAALEAEVGRDIVQASSPKQYADKILELLASEEERKKIGKSGRLYVEKYHRWSVISENLVRIYQRFISAKPR